MKNGIDTEALTATIDAVRDNPQLARVTFGVHSDWVSGCRQDAETTEFIQNGDVVPSRQTRYTLHSDEPMALLGTDTAASPAEYVLQAIAGCYAVTFASIAAMRGIELASLALELQADFDLTGFLGLDESQRPGATGIRVDVHLSSPNATDEQLRELTQAVEERSPIRDTLANAVDVRTTLFRKSFGHDDVPGDGRAVVAARSDSKVRE